MEKRNKKIILIAIVIVLSVVALFYFYDFLKEGQKNISNIPDTQEPAVGNTIVEITNEGYNPQTVVIKKGAVVTWINKGDQTHTVSSDPHPTHTDLPGLTSNPMQSNQSFSFAFEKAGSFGYHCHFHPSVKGRVIVKE